THIYENIKAINWVTNGFNSSSHHRYIRCWATLGVAASTSGFQAGTHNAISYVCCVSNANPCPGFSSTISGTQYLYCISASNTGASSDGFQSTGGTGDRYESCIAYNNGRDGIRITVAGGGEDSRV